MLTCSGDEEKSDGGGRKEFGCEWHGKGGVNVLMQGRGEGSACLSASRRRKGMEWAQTGEMVMAEIRGERGREEHGNAF